MQRAHSSPYPRPKEELLRPIDIEDDEPVFKIRRYKKSELAELYGINKNTLANWINRHYDAFERLGYRRTLRELDPCMVRLFVEIFSTP